MTAKGQTILFYTADGFGHINPSLQIGHELFKRGYRVILMTNFPTPFSQQVLDMGLELDHCVENPLLSLREISEELTSIMIRPTPLESFQNMFEEGNLSWRLLQDFLTKEHQLRKKLESYEPDLLIFDQILGLQWLTQIAPKCARIFSGFPTELYRCENQNCVAGLGLKLKEMTPEMKRKELEITKNFRNLLREHFALVGCQDLPSDLEFVPSSRDLNFYLGPDELSFECVQQFKPLPDSWFRLEHVIPVEKQEPRSFELPDCLANLPGKLIYFSLGSTCVQNKAAVERQNRLLEIMSKSPHRFIVSMGQMHEQVKLHPNMWGREFVDQKAILPIIDLYITHGGHNSTMEAFYYGVPAQIVMPLGADQFDCAQRIEDCGFGKRLNFHECTAEELSCAIESLLANQELKVRMKSISKRLQNLDYIKIAADKLVDYLEE